MATNVKIEKLQAEYDALAKQCAELNRKVPAADLFALTNRREPTSNTGKELAKTLAAKLKVTMALNAAKDEDKQARKAELSRLLNDLHAEYGHHKEQIHQAVAAATVTDDEGEPESK